MVSKSEQAGQSSRRGLIAGWSVSLLLHVGLILVGLAVTWSVIHTNTERTPRAIVASFTATTFVPVAELPDSTDASVSEVEPLPPMEIELPELVGLDAVLTPAQVSLQPTVGRAAQVSLAGVQATNARSIAYVIDASGSMTTWLSLVLEALSQSLNRLASNQRYTVFFFQGDRVLRVPPVGRLQAATPRAIRRTMAWTQRGANLIPSGGSDPSVAMATALEMQPDVIFLLSEGFGVSDSVDHQAVLDELAHLNPIASPTDGRRWTTIHCIQVGGPDAARSPSVLMQRIAAMHGGPDAWTFLSRDTLEKHVGDIP